MRRGFGKQSDMKKKILIGFATKTSAILPKFFCPLFRHCVIVAGGVRTFLVWPREIKKLEDAGWVFLELKIENGESRINFPFSILNF